MPIRSISQTLKDLQSSIEMDRVSFDMVLDALHERGFGIVVLIFALPMAMPLPVPPGINIVLATPIILLTFQQAIGRRTIWLPKRLRRKDISRARFDGFLDRAIPLLQKVEILIKPRLAFMTRGVFSNLVGVLGLIMALATAIPLPLTNTVPCIGISIMALGVLARDGLAVLAGALIGALWVLMLGLGFYFLGHEAADFIKDTIKGFV